jgi:type IV secretion system protein VirB10
MSPAMAIQLAAQTMEPQVAANGAASGTSAAPRTSSAGTVQQQSAAAYASPHGQGYLNAIREPAISKYEIWPGRYLRMLLDTAIIVDLPGQVCAHFIEPARDSQTGTIVLFPERTELCGTYNTLVATGASRIQIAWKQATFPDGSTLALDNMGSADRNGWSGLSADVNNHMGAVYGSAFITSVLAGVAAATDPSSNPNALIQVQTPGQAAGKSILQTGENIVSQKLSLPPTLSLKKSTEILLSVDRAIVLPAYHAIPAMDQK